MTITATQPFRSISVRQRRSAYGVVALIFLVVIWLEYTTPSVYVFGYLYTGAIVLTYRYLGRPQVISVTLAAVGLTLFNLIFPIIEIRSLPTLANRLIATASLLIAAYFTERNRFYESEIAQQQAQIKYQAQLAELREDFVSTLTHDLKTPLLGAIETIQSFHTQQFGPVSQRQHQVLDVMARSHNDTLHLVEAMLDVYRNDAEGLSLERSPVELRSLLTKIIASLTSLAQSKEVEITLTSAHDPCWIDGDASQLQRVFENLLANAISHTETGTQVHIKLKPSDNHKWQVQIQDAGPGIDAKEIPYLFVRFYQGHSNRQSKGYGLGLYLSRQIIEAHGGKIWAQSHTSQSRASQTGATFYCTLPVAFQS